MAQEMQAVEQGGGMIGIVSYGGYIPRLRLNRTSIYQQIGWLVPAVVMVAQGERSMCNWDEDSLTMAVAATRDCLAGLDKREVDALYLASTTLPFADRLNAAIAATALNLRDDIRTADFASALKAGTTALLAALDAAERGDQVLLAASDRRETRAGSFYEMWYGDGAAALLLGSDEVIAEFRGAHSLSYDFVSHYRGAGQRFNYTWEERWVRDQGYAQIIPRAVDGLLDKLGLAIGDVDRLVYPCFVAREHANIARKLGATPEQVAGNLHEVCGETGAAHPLVMLARALEEAQPGDRIVVASFGQGCDALCFEVTPHIRSLAPRNGIKGSLENREPTDNYFKFLKFRDLVETEAGIRAEAPDQTALTVLWRKRKMILGLVGGRCTVCGTPQYPQADICVNPECGALHSQEEYEFADVPGVVKSFTGDMLAVSVDPPAIYGLVQFEGGGRFMADFTDCAMDDVEVGMPVRMVFRRHYVDRERGFTGYFWKAVPQPVKKEVETAAEEDGEALPDLGDVHRNWDRIDSLRGAREYHDANKALMDMLSGPKEVPDELEAEGEAVSGKPAAGRTLQDVFDHLLDAFQPAAAAGVDVVFQFSLSGPGGGDWYTTIKEGACTVEVGVHPKPTTTLRMSDEDFLQYVGGQLPAMQAYTTGRLKIEGDLMKSQLVERMFKF